MNTDQLDDTTAIDLLHAVWQDSPSGWQQLVQLYTPFVYRSCRASGLSPDDSADVGQEVFQAVANKISSFRRESAGHSFRGWLHTITRHKIIDHVRRDQRGAHVSLELVQNQVMIADAVYAESSLNNHGTSLSPVVSQIVDQVRSEFEEASWQAFWRTAVEGQRAADVAHALEISVNAVYLARSRILRRIRGHFENKLEFL